MVKTIGLLIFDDAEELDFVGPWEVFTASKMALENSEPPQAAHTCVLISQTGQTVRCNKGMRVAADHSFEDCPPLDVLLVPGGQGTRREVENAELIEWVQRTAQGCTWVTSVCTGSLILTAAGPAKDRRVTTHWGFVKSLRERNEAADVVDDARFVRDGNVVTAAGVSAGIDMALWLIGQIYSPGHARQVQKYIEYDPAPPYTAEV